MKYLLFLLVVGTVLAQVRQEWARSYNGPGNSWDYAYGLAVDPTGNVYLTGESPGSDRADFATVSWGPDGTQRWVARYNGPGNDADRGLGVVADSMGNCYVVGQSSGAPDDYDFVVIKYRPDGDTAWVRRFDLVDEWERGEDIALGPGGTVYATGWTVARYHGPNADYDYLTLKYDSTGALLWSRQYDVPNGPGEVNSDHGEALVVDGAGNCYVTGTSYIVATDYDIATIKYGPQGETLWVRRYNGPRSLSEEVFDIALDPRGGVAVTGSMGVGYTGLEVDGVTVNYDADGSQRWVSFYNGPDNSFDLFYAVAVDAVGNAYSTGYSFGGTGTYYDYATLAYGPDGSLRWVRRYTYSGARSDYAVDAAVDADGDLYVTGWSTNLDTQRDFATLKYSPEGDSLWAVRYNGPDNGNDEPVGLALGPGGSVYVAGYEFTYVNRGDYAVVKYGQESGITGRSGSGAWSGVPATTIVRGVLFLPASGEGRKANGELLDISGRKVLDLQPGACCGSSSYDVSRLTPGVYFVRYEPSAVRRVIVTR